MRSLRRNWTRHSVVLSFAGAIYIAIGVAFFYVTPEQAKNPSLKVALEFLSLSGWGIVFISVGCVALLSSISPVGHKTWGYMVLTALSSGWATFYLMAILFADAPKIGLISTFLWILLAIIWWAVSGLISPQHLAVMLRDRD